MPDAINDDVSIPAQVQGYISSGPILSRVFDNLLDNSIRHDEGTRRVMVRFDVQGPECRLFWEDDGLFVEEAMKERIFQRGEGKNAGFGLFLSREILEITGIRLIEDGFPGTGDRFHMTMPEGAWKMDTDSRKETHSIHHPFP